VAPEVPPIGDDLLHFVSALGERREARRLLQRRLTFEARESELEYRAHDGKSHCGRESDVHAREDGSARRVHMNRTSQLLERRTAKHGREVGHIR
jgi:hypothetical protein